ncbi:MAG TPA: glutamate-5-semialdehyde dehydrogenase, partial [Micromonosporaceae bacterium]|nr:glutamate-5-semialdehyde dehydrogenase [Micromonosporaceae bacterium]
MSTIEQARRAREASIALATLTRTAKDAALHAMADALIARTPEILTANTADLAAGRGAGLSDALLDRLALSDERIASMAAGLRQMAALPDPVGEVVRGSVLANGLELRQVRVPFGVVGIIYEARPNVTADAAGICLKAGNAVLLRGSSSAAQSNAAIVAVLRDAIEPVGLPADAIQLLDATTRDSVKELMRARGLVDVLIPRGGASLIKSVVEESTVPVIETGVGNCHVYVDAAADLDKALAILLNAKTQRLSVCNTAESLLVHADVAAAFLPRALSALTDAGMTVHGCEEVAAYDPAVVPATEEDYATEYLSADISAAVVPSLSAAVEHIRRYGSGHSEAIVT